MSTHKLLPNKTYSRPKTLTSWFRTPLGRELAALELQELQEMLAKLNGQTLLQLGDEERLLSSFAQRTPHYFAISQERIIYHKIPTVHGEFSQLPFPDEVFDLVLLPHSLEQMPTSSPIIEETWRVLAANGHLIIIGFNPWSIWGLWRLFSSPEQAPWNQHFHSAEKLQRQLIRLQADIILGKTFCFRSPATHKHSLTTPHWLEQTLQLLFPAFGGAYVLLAKKQLQEPIRLQTKWRWQTVLTNNKGLAEPTTRGVKRG